MALIRNPIIIDIEALDFGDRSYPIEVGVALDDDTKYCSLILSEEQMARWHDTKDRLLGELKERRHRASFDAWVIQQTYNRTMADSTV